MEETVTPSNTRERIKITHWCIIDAEGKVIEDKDSLCK